MTSVLIVDDHALVRHALSFLIEQTPELEVCGQAESVDAARQCVDTHQPDLVILDLCLGNSRWEGIGLIELSSALQHSASTIENALMEEPALAGLAQRIHDEIGITMQLILDEIEEVYHHLSESPGDHYKPLSC